MFKRKQKQIAEQIGIVLTQYDVAIAAVTQLKDLPVRSAEETTLGPISANFTSGLLFGVAGTMSPSDVKYVHEGIDMYFNRYSDGAAMWEKIQADAKSAEGRYVGKNDWYLTAYQAAEDVVRGADVSPILFKLATYHLEELETAKPAF